MYRPPCVTDFLRPNFIEAGSKENRSNRADDTLLRCRFPIKAFYVKYSKARPEGYNEKSRVLTRLF